MLLIRKLLEVIQLQVLKNKHINKRKAERVQFTLLKAESINWETPFVSLSGGYSSYEVVLTSFSHFGKFTSLGFSCIKNMGRKQFNYLLEMLWQLPK